MSILLGGTLRRLGEHCAGSLLRAGACAGVRAVGTSAASPTKLHEVVDLEALSREPPHAIRDIWHRRAVARELTLPIHAPPLNPQHARSFHEARSAHQVGLVLSAGEYVRMQERARQSPMITLPVPKSEEQGALVPDAFVTVLVQAQLPAILATTVADFTEHGANAPARFQVTVYTELAEAKDCVLVRGDIVDKGLLEWQDAAQLLRDICAMWIDDERYQHVHAFNHVPEQFQYDAVLQLCGCKAA